MPDEQFSALVGEICAEDSRYRPGAYEFMSEAVAYTVSKLHRECLRGLERHVCGAELIAGVAEYAKKEFGVLAWDVLSDWGLTSGPSVGDVVYNMFSKGLLTSSEKDSREDFSVVGSLRGLVDAPSVPAHGGNSPVAFID